ncbi:MAG: DUF4239 domain-containing protein [Candidatus Eremiobacteraeota bacterium]|nr:DUF4239 domain-containing protein [Candidatus Eremiobacteraeota bacterium]
MTLLYEIPPAILLLVAIIIAVAIAAGGQQYLHGRFRDHDFIPHNEVGGFIIAVVGSLYAVLLGFLTVVAWQHFAEARDLVAAESASAADAWHSAVGLPYVVRSHIRDDMLTYAKTMVEQEWPDMRTGEIHPTADLIVMDAIGAAGDFTPLNQRQSNAQAATLQQLTILHDDRLRRIFSSQSGVSWFEWVVLILGAVCVIGFCWLFGTANPRAHLVMTAIVAVVITSVLVLLFELQYPFRTAIGVGPTAWQATIDHIRLMQAGSQTNMRM